MNGDTENTSFLDRASSLAESIVSFLGPEEAEASPLHMIGKGVSLMTKRGAKMTAERAASSTAEKLLGVEFKGSTIKNVLRGPGDTRYIVTEDEKVYPVSKDVVSSLVRTMGTKSKMAELSAKEGESALEQALKSLHYHESRAVQFGGSRRYYRDSYKQYKQDMLKANQTPEPYSLVNFKGRNLSIPTPYAKILEREGVVKVVEDLK